jgi:hypothetical protein
MGATRDSPSEVSRCIHFYKVGGGTQNIGFRLMFKPHPCGGGVEYLHRDLASRKRRRDGTKKGRALSG